MKSAQQIVVIPVEQLLELIENVVSEVLRRELQKKTDPFSDYPDHLTRKQTAEILNVNVRTVDTWANEGRIKRLRNGSAVRFSKEQILKLLK